MNKYGRNVFYGYAWKYVLRTQQMRDVEFLRSVYPASTQPVHVRRNLSQFWDELRDFSELRKAVESYQQFVKTDYNGLILNETVWLPLLYFLVRIKKPELVIETGCATGTTASLILYALQQNRSGHLYSIDLRFPSDWLTLNSLPSGFLVPEVLKARWSLILKDTKVALPNLLSQLGHVNFFFHDSDHSYVHQMWEYLTAWPYLSAGGILASDDILDNTALFDFARQVPGQMNISSRGRNFGIIVKS
jgi:predicted O-methyltransferase YrrM